MKPGFFINPDDTFTKGLKKRIKQNNGYCLNKRDKTPDTKCPCKEFRDTGSCDCGLYIKDPTYIIADEVPIDREAQMEAYV